MAEEEKDSAPAPAPAAPAASGSDVEQNKGMAAIAYLGILFLIPMFLKKDSQFAMYHAKQGMVLFICEVIVSFLVWTPFMGGFLSYFTWILNVFIFILFIMGIMNALGGKMKPLPVIGSFADKINV